MKFRLPGTKPDWQSSDQARRMRAAGSGEIDQPTLELLARDDPAENVRLAAIPRLNDADILRQLSRDACASVASAAVTRWVSLLEQAPAVQGQSTLESLPAEDLLTIACKADGVEWRKAAITVTADNAVLLQILKTENYSEVHQQCVDRIDDATDLGLIHKTFLGKDKTVARLARQKLDVIEARAAREQKLREDCQRLDNTLSYIESHQSEPELQRRMSAAKQNWADIVHEHGQSEIVRTALPDIEARLAACDAVIAERTALINQIAEDAASAFSQVSALVASLKISADELENIEATLSTAMATWPADNEDQALTGRFNACLDELRQVSKAHQRSQAKNLDECAPQLLRKFLDEFVWPQEYAEPPILEVARERLKQFDKDQAIIRQRSEDLAQGIAALADAIETGKTRHAERLHREVGEKLKAGSDKALQANYRELSTRLHELKDWQGFATVPKRQHLCEQMEKLEQDEDIHPAEKARAIKELQTQWKQLGASHEAQAQRLWERFNKAAEGAYRPCSEYFEAQRQTRDSNLVARQSICTSLTDFIEQHEWANADWKLVRKTLNDATREWRKYDNVPRGGRRDSQNQFDQLCGQLQQRLSEELDHNKASKAAILDEVNQMLASAAASSRDSAASSEDSAASNNDAVAVSNKDAVASGESPEPADQTIDEIVARTKQLQQDWRQVGIIERRDDQKLWKRFRKACDRVFELRDQAFTQKKDQQRQAQDRIIASLRAHIEDPAQLTESVIRALTSEYEAIPARAQKIFHDLVKQARNQLVRKKIDSKTQLMAEISRRADLCMQFETAQITREQLDADWHSDIDIEPKILARLDQRRTVCATDQLSTNLQRAEQICTELEILMGIESPAEAEQQRMEFQVARLQREFSRREKDTRSTTQRIFDLQMDWFCLALPSSAEAVRRRFEHVMNATKTSSTEDLSAAGRS